MEIAQPWESMLTLSAHLFTRFVLLAFSMSGPAWTQPLPSVSMDDGFTARPRLLSSLVYLDGGFAIASGALPAMETETAERAISLEPGFEAQWILTGDPDATDIGLEASVVDVKWPWLSGVSAPVELSFHPELEFDNDWPLLVDPATPDGGEELLVPLEAAVSVGPLSLAPRVGLLLAAADSPDRWALGLCLGFAPWERLELSGEIGATASQDLSGVEEYSYELAIGYELSTATALIGGIELHSDGHLGAHELLFHLGVRSTLTDGLDLLLAVGGASGDFPGSAPDLLVFPGLEWAF
jgi:hypothetical protein